MEMLGKHGLAGEAQGGHGDHERSHDIRRSFSNSALKQGIPSTPPYSEANDGATEISFFQSHSFLSFSLPPFHPFILVLLPLHVRAYLLVRCAKEMENNRQERGGRECLNCAFHQPLNRHSANADRGRKQTTNRKLGLTIESVFLMQ